MIMAIDLDCHAFQLYTISKYFPIQFEMLEHRFRVGINVLRHPWLVIKFVVSLHSANERTLLDLLTDLFLLHVLIYVRKRVYILCPICHQLCTFFINCQ